MSYQITVECVQCGMCEEICQAGAIVKMDQKYVIIAEKCESCGACAAECPKGAITSSGPTANFESEHTSTRLPEWGECDGRHFHHAGHKHQHRFMNWIGWLVPIGGENRRRSNIETKGERGFGRCENRKRRLERHRWSGHSSNNQNNM